MMIDRINRVFLKFESEELEKRYQSYSLKNNLFKIRAGAILGIFLFMVFGVIDYLIIGRIIPMVWILRILYILIAFIYIAFTYTDFFKRHSQLFMSVTILIGGLIIIATMAIIDSEVAHQYYPALLVLIMFVNYFGVQFRYSIIINAILIALYNFMELNLGIHKLSALELLNNNFFLISGCLIGLLACYTIDFSSRVVFLQRKRIKTALQEADQANQAKSDFLANMSHEIRTPLNAVLGLTQILLIKNRGDEQTQKYLTQINDSGRHVVSLVDSILDLSKIEANKMTLLIEKINLQDLIKANQQLLQTTAREKNVSLTYSIQPDVPEVIDSDYTKLNQIIMNLTSNALKFTHEGGVHVEFSMVNDTTLQMAVKDDGIGISPDKIDSIFSNFEQEDNSTTRNYGGTGLGLTISKGLVELLSGKIWVESQVGKGSIFFVHLPITQAATQTIMQEENLENLENPEQSS